MCPEEIFKKEVKNNIQKISLDKTLHDLSTKWIKEITHYKWAYNFSWLGRPAIQFPNDAWSMQEIIWQVKPDLIIETGIAHGGSLVFSASMLALLDICDAMEKKKPFDPSNSDRKVLAVDIDIRAHNRSAIEAHPMSSRIQMTQGSSVAPEVIAQVHSFSKNYKNILVCLDSNHTEQHVLAELKAYAPLTSVGSYCVVFDTIIEDLPKEMFPDRAWGPGNNPKTAVREFLKKHPDFEIDKSIQTKLLITVAPDGYLKRIS